MLFDTVVSQMWKWRSKVREPAGAHLSALGEPLLTGVRTLRTGLNGHFDGQNYSSSSRCLASLLTPIRDALVVA